MYMWQWILQRLFLLLPIGFSVMIILSLVSGDYKECLIIFLAMLNYNFLFIVIMIKFTRNTTTETTVSQLLGSSESNRNPNDRALRHRMNVILAIIIFNMLTISYVIILNFYAVMMLFFGDSLFNRFCTLNCMSDPKSAKQVILFNIIFLLSDVTWVLRAEIYFLKQYEMYFYPERYMYPDQEAGILEAIHNRTNRQREVSLVSEELTTKLVLRDTTCHICLAEIEDDERLIIMKCTHYFHSECIRQWVRIRQTCPTCRTAIVSNRTDENALNMIELQSQAGIQTSIEMSDVHPYQGRNPVLQGNQGSNMLQYAVNNQRHSITQLHSSVNQNSRSQQNSSNRGSHNNNNNSLNVQTNDSIIPIHLQGSFF